jgi:hypothetical protein
MKRLLLFIGLLLPTTTHAFVNLSGTFSEDGGYKMAQQDEAPYVTCSSCEITRAWDGTNLKLFGGKGELLTWVTYLLGGSTNATNVMVTISSFTGTGTASGSGFAAVAVSSTNVWNYTTRPYTLYKYSYLQEIGMNKNGPWDPSEYEMRQDPIRWRTPCTVNVNNDCVPNGGTYTFLNRADANKFYPDPEVPIEEFAASSFTVAASSSLAIGGEVYISTTLPAGTYTATMTVYEGATVSTSIPVQLLVYNFTMPQADAVPVIADVGLSDLSMRFQGVRNPASQFVDPYLTTGIRTAAFLHRHRVNMIGDAPRAGQDYPSAMFTPQINGTAFTSTYGYGNGPNAGVGNPFYMIGTYGSWQSFSWSTSTITNGSTGYCDNVSSWTYYCNQNGLNCALYTPADEASPAVLAGEVNTLSTWSSTVTACANGGHTLPFAQTDNLPVIISSAPKVNFALSASWIGVASATWASDENTWATTPGLTAAGYNSEVPYTDSLFALQEAGIGPREVMWGAWKYGQKYWYLWEINYWNDSNNAGQTQNGFNANGNGDNNLFNISKTYGYDLYPSTDPIFGHTGYAFANADGNMIYPGTDQVYANPSYGFNGVIGSWRLNELTRGIQDADIINLAYSLNPSATTAIVNSIVQNAMWTNQCFDLTDCTYTYGNRPWDENENDYETSREALEQIIVGGRVAPTTNAQFKGTVTIRGTARVQ